jgi:hypothetical protein
MGPAYDVMPETVSIIGETVSHYCVLGKLGGLDGRGLA